MGISVPNTNNFSLRDVFAAVADHANPTGDLRSCFENANPAYFDSAYNNDAYAPAFSMKRFRNYTPFSTPAAGVYTIPNPYPTIWFKGITFYISKDGQYLFILVLDSSSGAFYIFKYVMSTKFNLNTATYIQLLNVPTITGLQFWNMQFSDDGTRLMILNHVATVTSAFPVIKTFILSTAWDLSTISSWYDTNINVWSVLQNYSEAFCFDSTGLYLLITSKISNLNRFVDKITLSSPFTLPTGTITSTVWGYFGTSQIGSYLGGLCLNSNNSMYYTAITSSNYAIVHLENNNWDAANTPNVYGTYVDLQDARDVNIRYANADALMYVLEFNYNNSVLFPRISLKLM